MEEINHEKIEEFQRAIKDLAKKFEQELTQIEIMYSVMEVAAIYVFSVATAAEISEKESYGFFYNFQGDMLTCFKELMSRREEVLKELEKNFG